MTNRSDESPARSSGDVRDLAELGRKHEKSGDYDRAIEVLERARTLEPRDLTILQPLASCLRRREYLSKAEQIGRQCIDLAPHSYNANRVLGNILYAAGKIEEAEDIFRRALAIKPDSVNAWFNLARSHRFANGESELLRLLKLDPNDPRLSSPKRSMLLFALGKAHDDIGAFQTAFDYYIVGNNIMAKCERYRPNATVRHVNRIIKIYEQMDFPKPSRHACDRVTPVFVVGASRSGKTLIASILGGYGGVCDGFENRDFAQVLAETTKDAGITGIHPDFVLQFAANNYRAVADRYLASISTRMKTYDRFFMTTSPLYSRYIGFIFKCFPNAKVIFCHRDPLDQCLQIFFKRYNSGNVYARQLEWIGHYYKHRLRLHEYWQRRLGDRILVVHYEDLVRQPLTTARVIERYCGIRPPAPQLQLKFDSREIGHWKNYAAQLKGLRTVLWSEIGSS